MLQALLTLMFHYTQITKDNIVITKTTTHTQQTTTQDTIDCTTHSCVAITFDDGPQEYTEELLDILAKNNIKVTFFVIGNKAQKYPNTIKRMYREGHEIGSHSRDHSDLSKITKTEAEAQIVKTDNILQQLIGHKPHLLRPPYGGYNDSLKKLMKKHNKSVIMRNRDTVDRREQNTKIVVTRMSKSKKGDIVLSHDIRKTTVDGMQQAIDNLRNQGYTIVRIKDMIPNPIPGKKYKNQYN